MFPPSRRIMNMANRQPQVPRKAPAKRKARSEQGHDDEGSEKVVLGSSQDEIQNEINQSPSDCSPEIPETSTKPKSKRARMEKSRVGMSYPRKRAVTACQLCRFRKTKCSNERPKCKICQDAGAECIYEDRSDHSSFDPASLVMLEKLNHIIDRLDTISPNPVAHASALNVDGRYLNQSQPFHQQPTGLSDQSTSPLSGATLINQQSSLEDEYMRIPSSRTCPDTILCWPIFQGKYPQDCLVNTLFGAEDAFEQEDSSYNRNPTGKSRRNGSSYVPREDNIQVLVEKFIALVHIKNPILDVDTLRRNARIVAENGPLWDGVSCLVLLACALGSLAQPLETEQQHDLSDIESLLHCKEELQAAESYYILARKRIGLLSNGIVRSQCYFWSGVYLMYTVKPLEAWQNFLQSSTTQHAYLKGRQNHLNDRARENQVRQLEQRLYWSCFKSECELRVELQLPESSIASIRYPDLFPSPPNPASPVMGERQFTEQEYDANTPMSQGSSVASKPASHTSDQMQQQSWFYYLTEIALRRIGNRILNAFYKDELSLNMPLATMIKHANDFEAESLQWHASLPTVLQFDPEQLDEPPTEELPYYIWARFLEVKHWIYLPFIFYAVHHGPENPYLDTIQPMIQKDLKHVFGCIRGLPLRHRHHGTWFGLRGSTAAAFIIIAVIKCGNINISLDWRDTIESYLVELKYWGKESPDIKKARCILETMLEELAPNTIC